MVLRCLSIVALAGACRDRPAPPAPAAALELRDAGGAVTARVVPGHPCRATVDGVELLVGGRPLVAQYGAARWTGEDGANGTTLRKNGVTVARIYANQLFDADGIPILRVTHSFEIVDAKGVVIAVAAATETGIKIGDREVVNAPHVMPAAMLAARDVQPEIRALATCHYLLEPP